MVRNAHDAHDVTHDATDIDQLSSVHSDDFLPAIGPWIRAGGFALVATVGSAIALAAVIRYTPTVEAFGVLKHAGEGYSVEAPVDGIIRQIQRQPNQMVHKGEAIALLDPTGPAPAAPISAPISGVVLKLNISHSNQWVSLGEAIATITPTLAPLTLKAQVSPEDIGEVLPCNQPVMDDCKVGRALVRVLSFPAPIHEPLSAVVRAISPDTLLPLEGDDDFFEVTLELPPAETIPTSMPLRAGMSVQVDILTEPKTVLSLLKKTSGNL